MSGIETASLMMRLTPSKWPINIAAEAITSTTKALLSSPVLPDDPETEATVTPKCVRAATAGTGSRDEVRHGATLHRP